MDRVYGQCRYRDVYYFSGGGGQGDSQPLASTTTATTFYSNENPAVMAPNTTYTYQVVAYDAAGNASGLSSSATTTTLGAGDVDGTAPSVPGMPVAIATGASTISLSWAASTDSHGVSGYNIYRTTSPSGTPSLVGTSTMSTYTDTGLTSATTYYYVVRAFDGFPNESLNSDQASATTP